MKLSREEGRFEMQYVRNSEIVERQLDDEVLLINIETDSIFNLNPIGTAVWQLLQVPKGIEEITETLQLAFPRTSFGQIEEDLNKLLHQLVEQELIIVDSE